MMNKLYLHTIALGSDVPLAFTYNLEGFSYWHDSISRDSVSVRAVNDLIYTVNS